MVTILHRELERKVEKVKHMKLEVMRPKTKNNINFQPRGVARFFQRGGHHPGIADCIWFIPLLSLVYQLAQSYGGAGGEA